MKSLDEQVSPAEDESAPAPAAVPTAEAVPPRRRRRRRAGFASLATAIIVTAVIPAIIRFTIDDTQNAAKMNAAIAKLTPSSPYNAKLSAALKTYAERLSPAEATLNDATYLAATDDFGVLYWTVSDVETRLDLYRGDLMENVSAKQYASTLASLDASFTKLESARLAVAADMSATPAPTPAPAKN